MLQRSLPALASLACLCPFASAQGGAYWDAASGAAPEQSLPNWTSGPSGTTVIGQSASGAPALVLESSSTAAPWHYSIRSGSLVLPQTPGSSAIEAELRVASSLGLEPDAGVAQLVLVGFPVCPWVLHVDADELFLESLGLGGQRTASVALDATSQARLYRLQVDHTTRIATALVDGQPVLTAPFAAGTCVAPGQNLSGIFFGNLSSEGGSVEWFRVSTDFAPQELSWCFGAAGLNSAGHRAYVSTNREFAVAANSLELRAHLLPQGSFGYFLCSRAIAPPVQPPGSAGGLCLGGSIGRFSAPGQVQQPSPTGNVALGVDLATLPQPTGPVSAAAGETWAFQYWYRDAQPGTTSNISTAHWLTFE